MTRMLLVFSCGVIFALAITANHLHAQQGECPAGKNCEAGQQCPCQSQSQQTISKQAAASQTAANRKAAAQNATTQSKQECCQGGKCEGSCCQNNAASQSSSTVVMQSFQPSTKNISKQSCQQECGSSCSKNTDASASTCPHCTAEWMAVDTHLQSHLEMARLALMPGHQKGTAGTALPIAENHAVRVVNDHVEISTGPTKDQMETLARQRTNLSNELSEYLTNGNHDPQHVQQVLEMALERSALAATRESMSPRQHRERLTVSTGMPLPYAHATTPAEREFDTATDPQEPEAPELAELKQQQQSLQHVITLIQRDLERVAEDVSLLHVQTRQSRESNKRTRQNPPRRASSENMTTRIMPTSRQVGQPIYNAQQVMIDEQLQTINQLRVQIRSLQEQVSSSSSSQFRPRDGQQNVWQSESPVRQATLETPVRQRSGSLAPIVRPSDALRPKSESAVSLRPVARDREMITISYYVGDMLQPPFHRTTLHLIKHLKESVAPDSWETAEMIQISEPSITLLVTQTRANHELIAERIRDWRIAGTSFLYDQEIRR